MLEQIQFSSCVNQKFAYGLEDIVLGALEKQGLDFWWIDWQQGGADRQGGAAAVRGGRILRRLRGWACQLDDLDRQAACHLPYPSRRGDPRYVRNSLLAPCCCVPEVRLALTHSQDRSQVLCWRVGAASATTGTRSASLVTSIR